MSDQFRWSVDEFLGTPPLDMILEGLGTLCAIPLEVRDPSGGKAALGPEPAGEEGKVLSPIQVQGREAGMVVGYTTRDEDQRVPMTVALAASLISQFLRSTREARNLTVEVDRRGRGLSLLDRAEENRASHSEQDVARWFLREALSLVGASAGALFAVEEEAARALAWEGGEAAPQAGALTRLVARSGEPLVLQSLGRLPAGVARHGEGEPCPLEGFVATPALALPVRFGDRCLGVLWACGRREGGRFTAEDRQLMRGVASQIGLYLWGGRAVDTLRAEEAARRTADADRFLRERYLAPGGNAHHLAVETGGPAASGCIALPDGRTALWVAECDECPGVGAAVVRTALEAEAGRADGLTEMVTGAARTLQRLEEDGAPLHRLLVAAFGEGDEIDAAWRGFVEPPRLAGPDGEDPLQPDGEGDGVSAARFPLPPGVRLSAPGGSFHLQRREGGGD